MLWLLVLTPALAAAHEFRYLEPGSAFEYAAVIGPPAAEAFGAAGAAAYARARQLGAGLPGEEAGAPTVEPLDLAWHPHGRAPFGAAMKGDACDCATSVGELDHERVVAVHVRTVFTVGDEAASLRVLHLRTRYLDGLSVFINGVEVVRDGMPAGASWTAPALRIHGPEWQTFHVPAWPGLLHTGENHILVEARGAATRAAPLLDLALTASDVPGLARGPILGRVSATGAAITFVTDIPARAEVRFVAGDVGSGRTVPSSAGGEAVRHLVTLGDLPPASVVRYHVVIEGAVGPELSFHTAPVLGAPVRFVVYGDSRSGHRAHAEILASVLAAAPDFVIHTGDLVLRGRDQGDWQRYFALAGDLLARIPVYPALGNHDLGGPALDDLFPLPAIGSWYGFDVGGVHVAVLDSARVSDPAQATWLDADLAAARARGATVLFAVAHQGAWSHGPHGGDDILRQRYVPILVAHGVAVLFSGHDHIYERGQVGGLRYVVSGGGGAELYEPRCGRHSRGCKKDGVAFAAGAHHFVLVEVSGTTVRMCARRPDGRALEECETFESPGAD